LLLKSSFWFQVSFIYFNLLVIFMFDKRGIAPLVATLLLISFAVSLGVVVMNFGKAQVELEAQCPIDIGMKLSKIGGDDQFCYDRANDAVSFTLENGVNIKVDGVIMNFIGTKGATTANVADAKMDKLGNYFGNIPYDVNNFGEIRQVKITPKIILYEEEQICLEKALIVEQFRDC